MSKVDADLYEVLSGVDGVRRVAPVTPTVDRSANLDLPMIVYSLDESVGIATLDEGMLESQRTYSVLMMTKHQTDLGDLEGRVRRALDASDLAIVALTTTGDDKDVEVGFAVRGLSVTISTA